MLASPYDVAGNISKCGGGHASQACGSRNGGHEGIAARLNFVDKTADARLRIARYVRCIFADGGSMGLKAFKSVWTEENVFVSWEKPPINHFMGKGLSLRALGLVRAQMRFNRYVLQARHPNRAARDTGLP